MHRFEQTLKQYGRLITLAMYAGMFLLVLGARMHLVEDVGSQVPFWDEWLNEPPILRLADSGELKFKHLLINTNEHRILWSRITLVLIFFLNDRQWDPQVVATFSALLGASVPILVIFLFGRQHPEAQVFTPSTTWWNAPVWLAAGVLSISPVLWFNAVWAFQNSFYFVMLLSLGGVALVCRSTQLSAGWWAGVVCLAASIVALGSGLLAPLVLIGWLVVWMVFSKRWEHLKWTLAACALLVLVGFLARPKIGIPANMRAETLPELLIALGRNFSWPRTTDSPALSFIGLSPLPFDIWQLECLILWLPAPILLGVLLLRPGFVSRYLGREGEVHTLAASTLWVYAQLALIAYLRGKDGQGPAFRHYDIHMVGLVLNVAALVFLLRAALTHLQGDPSRRMFKISAIGLVAAVYTIVFISGTLYQVQEAKGQMAKRQSDVRSQATNLRNFLATGDIEHIRAKPLFQIPFYDDEVLSNVINDTHARRLLPSILRFPLSPEPWQSKDGSRFSPRAAPSGRPRAWVAANLQPPIAGREVSGGAETTMGLWELPPSRFSYLLVGYTGEISSGQNVRLESLDAAGRVLSHSVMLPVEARSWGKVMLRIPSESKNIQVRGNLTSAKLAIMDPVEVGRFSYWASIVRRQSTGIIIFGAILLAAGNAALLALRFSHARAQRVLVQSEVNER